MWCFWVGCCGKDIMVIILIEKVVQYVQKYFVCCGKGMGLWFGVCMIGCLGFVYKFEYVDELVFEDQVFESYGVKVIVDLKSFVYIDGIEFDFVCEGLNEGFKFNNLNVKDECGCGELFCV